MVHHTGRMVGMLQGTLILTSGRENVRDDFVQPKNTQKNNFNLLNSFTLGHAN